MMYPNKQGAGGAGFDKASAHQSQVSMFLPAELLTNRKVTQKKLFTNPPLYRTIPSDLERNKTAYAEKREKSPPAAHHTITGNIHRPVTQHRQGDSKLHNYIQSPKQSPKAAVVAAAVSNSLDLEMEISQVMGGEDIGLARGNRGRVWDGGEEQCVWIVAEEIKETISWCMKIGSRLLLVYSVCGWSIPFGYRFL